MKDFVLWCEKNNKNVIINFTKTQNSLFHFFNFLKSHISKRDLIEDMEKSLSFLNSHTKRYTYPSKNDLTKTLRMTIVSID